MTKIQKKLSFDDVLLTPQHSYLTTRSEADISTMVGHNKLNLPIISAPMDTITNGSMALFMWEKGGMGIIHRYLNINQQYAEVKWAKEYGAHVGAAVGVNGDSDERAAALVEAGADLLVMDVAHGDSESVIEKAAMFKEKYNMPVMSGNIATAKAAINYVLHGIDLLRVGIGPGASCSTRVVTGVGVPQLSAIMDVNSVRTWDGWEDSHKELHIVADGGVKNSGDAVKALAAGADAVMAGGLFAGFDITAGRKHYIPDESEQNFKTYKEFRGMASDEALSTRGKKNFVVEGEAFTVPIRYDHDEFVSSLYGSIQTGFAYLGARNIRELRKNAVFVEVSSQGFAEGLPRGV